MTAPVQQIAAALLLSVAAVSPVAAQRATCTPVPVASSRSLPPFPSGSLERGEQGITALEVMVARNGRPSAARVIKSSGFPRLDAAAAAHVRQYYRWQPMTCASAKTTLRVRWDPAAFCALNNSCKRSMK